LQLEVGPTATPFERRFIGNELAMCQRYYTESPYGYFPNTTTAGIWFRVSMRAIPQVTWAGSGGTIYNPHTEGFFGFSTTNTTAKWTANAEL